MEQRVSNISIINYINTLLLKDIYRTFCKDIGIEDDFVSTIEMKNEFLLDKQMLTSKKKTYASSIIQQEGNLIQPPEIDIKGMAIRKVNTNKNIRNKFINILKNEILQSDDGEINRIKIIKLFKEIEMDIKNSLLDGETEYLNPMKANNAEVYADPYSQMSYRAALTWNLMYPESEITLPTTVLLVKLNITSFDDIKAKITDEETLNRFREVFKNQNLVKNGMNVIAIDSKEIPEEIRPFINIDTMIKDHMKSGSDLLESIDVRILSTQEDSFISNIVRI